LVQPSQGVYSGDAGVTEAELRNRRVLGWCAQAYCTTLPTQFNKMPRVDAAAMIGIDGRQEHGGGFHEIALSTQMI
jgi:hypothetical protein